MMIFRTLFGLLGLAAIAWQIGWLNGDTIREYTPERIERINPFANSIPNTDSDSGDISSTSSTPEWKIGRQPNRQIYD